MHGGNADVGSGEMRGGSDQRPKRRIAPVCTVMTSLSSSKMADMMEQQCHDEPDELATGGSDGAPFCSRC